jgi:oligopeptide/dipeptide ABC transporter ATP-binding protein
MSADPILRVQALRKYFPVRNVWKRRIGWLKALDDVSFDVRRGEILGIVGESGCGKSTLGKTLMGIHLATSGSVVFEGHEIAGLTPQQSRKHREHLQYCYQDPGASLDPRWTIRGALHEPLIVHTQLGEAEREARVREILAAVGLPATHLDLYPHEISGGQQRRVGLARILTLKPSVVIFDEPTSGLDVSVQATILNLLLSLRQEFGLTYLFISHDLAVVRLICQRVAVMYLGRIVEIGETEAIFNAPSHPYTQSLLAAIPRIGGARVTDTFALEGEPPSPTNLPSGCRFRTRCARAAALCAEAEPGLEPFGDVRVACHFPGVVAQSLRA